MTVERLYALERSLAGDRLKEYTYPWEALGKIKEWIEEIGEALPKEEYEEIRPKVWAHRSASIAPTAYLGAPCIVGANTEVRHCAFIRGAALVGEGCVVGNSTELKNVILFDGAQVPHYNYVGDSILGYKAHMGAGAITSNVKADKTPVVVKEGEILIPTDRKKVGAFLGDCVEVGCNSVLNPGTVVGKNTSVYPLSCARGVIPENSIYKSETKIVKKK